MTTDPGVLDITRSDRSANAFAVLTRSVPGREQQPFLLPDDAPALTYAAMLDETARVGAWLRDRRVGPGDRVVAQVDKSVPAILFYLGCLRAGAVFVPLNTAYGEAEVAYFVGDAEPALVVASSGTAAERAGDPGRRTTLGRDLGSAPWRGVDPDTSATASRDDDPAAILYTSGTTGRSKGAILTHRNLSSNALILHEAWGWQEGDVLLHALPIFHVHGLFVALHGALLNGSTILFHGRFDPAGVVRDLPRSTVFMGVPTFYTRLLDHPGFDAAACAAMRLFLCGSAPLLPSTFEAFERRTGHAILERYGMTEALMVTSNPYEGRRLAGTVGRPLPGVDVRIAAEDGAEAPVGQPGMLQLKGPNLFAGYWRNPAKTAEEHTPDGYFVSGDIATRDHDGVIRIVGRGKDLIISGGYNVYPKEVEVAIDALDGVAESAVVGVPHPDFGEGVVAAVVLRPGAGIGSDAIASAIAPQLAPFKRPKHIALVDELPRNAMGKVQKAALRTLFSDLFAPEATLSAPKKSDRP